MMKLHDLWMVGCTCGPTKPWNPNKLQGWYCRELCKHLRVPLRVPKSCRLNQELVILLSDAAQRLPTQELYAQKWGYTWEVRRTATLLGGGNGRSQMRTYDCHIFYWLSLIFVTSSTMSLTLLKGSISSAPLMESYGCLKISNSLWWRSRPKGRSWISPINTRNR